VASPVFVAAPVPKPGQGNSIVIDFSARGVKDDDVLIVMGRSQGTVSAEIAGLPSGWARGGLNGSIGVNDRMVAIYYHVVSDAAAEPSSYTFTGISNGADVRAMFASAIVRGADLAHVNDGGLIYQSDGAIPSVNAKGVPYLLIAIWGGEFTAGVSVIPNSVPANLTTRLIAQTAGGTTPAVLDNSVTTGSRTGLVVGTQQVEEGGSVTVPAMTMGWPTAPTAVKSASLMIRGLTVAPPVSAPTKLGDGRAATVSYVGTDGSKKAPSRVGLWLPGFNDVDALLAKPGATMAHRGGSLNWPEYSELAYDRSVLRGYGALEFSCAFTNDATPVPFGMGDQYLDTFAGVTGNVDPTTLSWATISANYRNVLRPVAAGVTQPLLRLDQFLAKYTPTHTCLVDPKYGWANAAKVKAMLDICDAHGGPDKIIIKFDSPTTGFSLVDAAHARGYLTMNYWGTEVEKLTTAYGTDRWDLIGVRYDAVQSTYDVANSFGKPVWAAVVPDQSSYNTAIARGADLVMCSNVAGITRVR
jgi:glycerophosphoryl diester phosphodiesterase